LIGKTIRLLTLGVANRVVAAAYKDKGGEGDND